MLVPCNRAPNLGAARQMAESALENGSAWEKFRLLVQRQGGDVSFVDQPERLPKASLTETIPSPESGYLSHIDARLIGEASVALGAGRAKKTDPVDHAVGFEILHKVGEYVEKGAALFVVHANDLQKLEDARKQALLAHQFSNSCVESLPLFYN